jgi:autotransporter-associated beta strand protein
VANGGTLAFNRSNAYTFGGTISGGGGVTQKGSGTLTLTAANTYTGPTAVTAGTLLVDGSTAAASAVTVSSGATLGGTGTVGGTTTLNAGAKLAPGDGGGGTLSATGAVTFNGGAGSTWLIEVNGLQSTDADRLALSGAGSNLNLVLGGTSKLTLNLQVLGNLPLQIHTPYTYTIATADGGRNFRLNGGSYTFDPSQSTLVSNVGIESYSLAVVGSQLQLTFSPVPEPGWLLLVCAAGAGAAQLRRGRERVHAAA